MTNFLIPNIRYQVPNLIPGHFLDLRHIGGDAPTPAQGDNYDDYCLDTPNIQRTE